MMEQQASVCCLLVMHVTLSSGLGPAWNVDQDDLMAGLLCVWSSTHSPPIPTNYCLWFHLWV